MSYSKILGGVLHVSINPFHIIGQLVTMVHWRAFIFLFILMVIQLPVMSQSLILPQEVGNKRSQEFSISNVSFYEYPYISDAVDIRDVKRKYPNLNAPDTIHIRTNFISSQYDLTLLIGLENKENLTESDLIIWLASDYHTNEVLFFLNKNQNRDFDTNPDFLSLTSSDDVYTVILNRNTPGSNEMRLRLIVPKTKNKPRKSTKRITNRILNSLAIGLHFGIGTGGLSYKYDNLDIGFPTWYDINFTEKGMGLELSYNLPIFRFAVLANYNNSFSYTSYLNVRYDEPELFVSQLTGRTMIMENVDIQQNRDLHTNHKLDYAAVIGLRWHLKSLEIQPFVSLGQTLYLPGEYAGNRHSDQRYNLPSSLFYEAGMRLEFAVASHRSIYFDFSIHRGNWRPDGFFETIPFDNLVIDHGYFKFKAGYRLGL